MNWIMKLLEQRGVHTVFSAGTKDPTVPEIVEQCQGSTFLVWGIQNAMFLQKSIDQHQHLHCWILATLPSGQNAEVCHSGICAWLCFKRAMSCLWLGCTVLDCREREAIEIHKHCDLSINEKKFSLGHCNWVPALEYGKTAKPKEKSDAVG